MTGGTPIDLPLGFEGWSPVVQAITLGLMTFVQEDLPTISSAFLASGGKLSWKTGFIGCFLGIWVGDLLLYALARGIGRPLLEKSWAKRYFNAEKVRASEEWFATKGNWLLVSSRFIPGTRLPTYVAAGILKVPLLQFFGITGMAVAVWTVGIFVLAHFFGLRLMDWLTGWHQGGWMFLGVVIAMVIVIRALMSIFQKRSRQRLHARIGKWTRWEFWPPWLFYVPVAFHYLWLSLRHCSFTLPTSANPGIFSGGMVGESKMQTLEELTRHSPKYTAAAYRIPIGEATTCIALVKELCSIHDIQTPYILKPDVGQRGAGVKLIRNDEQLKAYFIKSHGDTVLQKYSPGPFEAGVFYYRFPGQKNGKVLAITEKVFPEIQGNGSSTLEELLWEDPRARIMSAKFLLRMGERRTEILPKGTIYRLVEAGNHAQGCIFKDGMKELHTTELEQCIDTISKQVTGFYIGRYDIRYSTREELKTAVSFQIIELNGAASEVTSIYDEHNTLWNAYRMLRLQWSLVFEIGAVNRKNGKQPMGLFEFLSLWRKVAGELSTLPISD